MSAPDTTKFQVNYKLSDGTLVNLYAKDVRDLETGLTDLAMVSALIKSTAADLGTPSAVATISAAFPGAQVVAQAPATPAAAPAGATTPMCAHGPMRFNSGTGAKGPWSGWFCAGPKELPREQKCDTIWKR